MASKKLPWGSSYAFEGSTLWIVAGGVIQGPVPSTFMRERSGGVFEAPLSMLSA
jgi:hypothetical protein